MLNYNASICLYRQNGNTHNSKIIPIWCLRALCKTHPVATVKPHPNSNLIEAFYHAV